MTCIGAYCYTTLQEARDYARYLSFITKKPHKPIKTKRLDINPKKEIECYMVIMV